MTPEERITSEEKLLKLIENPGNIRTGIPAGIKKKTAGIASFKNLPDIFKNIVITRYFTLKNINRNLLIITIIVTFGALFNFIKEYNSVKREFINITKEPVIKPETENPVFSVNFADTMNEAKKRNIFTLLPVKPEQIGAIEDTEIIINLKLVGILWSDNPQVMIEDTKTAKTYFLSSGEMIANLKIEQILKDKVILTNGEREWELR